MPGYHRVAKSSSADTVGEHELMIQKVRQTKQSVNRMHLIMKLGVILCIVLVIAVGITAILIISEMTDIANEIARLNDLGYRRTLAIQA
jgi:hypothetical protein